MKKFLIASIALTCLATSPAFSYEKIGGIKVHSKYNINNFPSHWVGGRINIWGRQVTKSGQKNITIAIRRFVNKYPKSVLNDNLSSVFLLKDLSFYGSYWGATYKWDRIYISYNVNDGDTVRFVTRELHHEFSSILLENYVFPKRKWIYATKGKYASKNYGIDQAGSGGNGRDEGTHLLERGLLTSYGASDFENDVNIYAEYLFVLPKRLARHNEKYFRIAKKTKLLKQFYCGINKSFHFCN